MAAGWAGSLSCQIMAAAGQLAGLQGLSCSALTTHHCCLSVVVPLCCPSPSPSTCRLQLSDYGKQRQWASIGYGLLSPVSGWLISKVGLDSAFLLYGLASLPLIAVGTQMRYKYAASSSSKPLAGGITAGAQQQQQSAVSSLEAPLLDAAPPSTAAAPAPAVTSEAAPAQVSLQQLVLQPRVGVFLWRCLLMGFSMGVMANYEFLWLKQLGAPETLMGLAIAVRGSPSLLHKPQLVHEIAYAGRRSMRLLLP